MALVAVDAGGTHIRFAVADSAAGVLREIRSMDCADFTNIGEAIAAYLESIDEQVDTFSIAIAGVEIGGEWRVINNDWRFGKDELRAATGEQSRLLLINDFTAQALAYSVKGDTPARTLLHDGGAGQDDAPLLVIGPGTGLGIAALVPAGDGGSIPVRGEGGHRAFAPRDRRTRELDDFMRGKTGRGHVATEQVLSGKGLEAIYEFLTGKTKTAAGITAKIDDDDSAREAVHIMLGILGGAVADNILTLGCWRGAVIAGGIVPRMAEHIKDSPFMARLHDAGVMSELLAGLPVWLATDASAGLLGAKAALVNPHVRGEWEW